MTNQNISTFLGKISIAFFTTLILLTINIKGFSQEYFTLYRMQGIPQSMYSNPALQPLPNYYVGLPGLSALYTGFHNTGFAPRDFLSRDVNEKLFIDTENLLSQLSERNFFIFDFNNELLGFGFRTKSRNYWSFSISERINSRLGYSDDLMHLVLRGNDPFLQQGTAANLGGMAFDMSHYRSYAFGFSRRLNDNLSAGIRVKALQGMSNINFKKSEFYLLTDQNTYDLTLRTNLLVNTSLPFQLSPLNEISNREFTFDATTARSYLTNMSNKGVAFDFGTEYQFNEIWGVALSILDMGFINWNSDVENFSANGEIEFEGVDLNDFISGSSIDQGFTDNAANLSDSIIDLLNITETNETYSLMLPTRVFLSASYNLSEANKFALMGAGEIYNGRLLPSVTVSYNYQPVNRFGSTFSYSVIHGNFHNVGFGMHVNIFPVQLYVVTDNFFPALKPHTFQTFNIQFGVNIAAGFTRKQAE